MRKNLFVLALVVFCFNASAQSCYTRLFEASGINTDAFQNDLEEAACALKDALPPVYQDSFRIFDFGFYLHNEVFIGSYPEIFNTSIITAAHQSKYYLLIGKQNDKNGLFTKFWIHLNLPEAILCTGENQESVLMDNIRWKMEDRYAEDNRNQNYYANAEIAGIVFLKDRITELVNCCETNRNRSEISCSDCPDEESIKRLLLEKEFTMADIDSLSINITVPLKNGKADEERMKKSDLMDGISEVTIWIDGFEWNLNQALSEEILSYPHASKKGVVASNEDMCLIDLYEKIRTDYYKSFEVAVILFVWVKKDQQGNIIDKKLFLKHYFPVPDDQVELPPMEEDDIVLSCHPSLGMYNATCSAQPLPIDPNTPDRLYTISTAVNTSEYAYFGFVYRAEILNWQRLDIVEYDDPVESYQKDMDNVPADCANYSDLNNWSTFARMMKLENTKVLVEDFERWTKNNALVGQKPALDKIVKHFYFGNGEPLIWDCNEPFSRYIAGQESIREFLQFFQNLCHTWLNSHNDFDDFIETNNTLIALNLPMHVPGPNASSIINASAAIAIGGIQGWKVGISSIKKVSCVYNHARCYEIELHLTLKDIFGAGTDDRDRGGPWDSRVPIWGDGRVPGLTQLWLLQHCRNYDCEAIGGTPPCFVPFEHHVNFGHKFKLCYDNLIDP